MPFHCIIIRPPLKACGGMLCAECAVIRAPVGDIEIKGIPDWIRYPWLIRFCSYAEEFLCIQSSYPCHIIQRNGFYFRNPPGGFNNKRRLVPLPPVRKRRKIRAVRLNEHPFNGNLFYNLMYICCLREGDNACEGEIHAHIKAFSCHIIASGKTVHYAANISNALIPEDIQCIILRLPAVYDKRQVQFPGKLYMPCEYSLLDIPRRMLIMIIKTGFAYGNDLLVAGQFCKLFKALLAGN